MTPPPGWPEAFQHAARSRVTLLLGDTDTGKTSLATYLANALLERGFRTGVVDADLGQSEIGPPTTVGLGCLRHQIERLRDLEVAGLYFVGSTSPPGDLLPTVVGTRKLVDRALALGCERVLVDTSGLVRGALGRTLKESKIDLVEPDLVICLQRQAECEHILRGYGRGAPPAVLRLAAVHARPARSQQDRRRHRRAMLDAHFREARRVRLELSTTVLIGPEAGRSVTAATLEPVGAVAAPAGASRSPDAFRIAPAGSAAACLDPEDALRDALAGVEDERRETLGLARVVSCSAAVDEIVLDTPVPPARIARVRIGRERYRPAGRHHEVTR